MIAKFEKVRISNTILLNTKTLFKIFFFTVVEFFLLGSIIIVSSHKWKCVIFVQLYNLKFHSAVEHHCVHNH